MFTALEDLIPSAWQQPMILTTKKLEAQIQRVCVLVSFLHECIWGCVNAYRRFWELCFLFFSSFDSALMVHSLWGLWILFNHVFFYTRSRSFISDAGLVKMNPISPFLSWNCLVVSFVCSVLVTRSCLTEWLISLRLPDSAKHTYGNAQLSWS
jgi:hypothetical protein